MTTYYKIYRKNSHTYRGEKFLTEESAQAAVKRLIENIRGADESTYEVHKFTEETI